MKESNVIVSRSGLETVGFIDDLREHFVNLAITELKESITEDTRESCLKDVSRIVELLDNISDVRDGETLIRVREDCYGWYGWNFLF